MRYLKFIFQASIIILYWYITSEGVSEIMGGYILHLETDDILD